MPALVVETGRSDSVALAPPLIEPVPDSTGPPKTEAYPHRDAMGKYRYIGGGAGAGRTKEYEKNNVDAALGAAEHLLGAVRSS